MVIIEYVSAINFITISSYEPVYMLMDFIDRNIVLYKYDQFKY